MRVLINPWITNTLIDSCAFDPKYAPEDQAAAEILALHRDRGLSLGVAHSTMKEIDHPNTPRWVKQEAASKIYTIGVQLTPAELALRAKLHALLTGNGQPEKMRQDAEHIFEAQKYGSYFVTTDRRLLDRAEAIDTVCTLAVIKPSSFLAVLRRHAQA